MKTLAFLLLLIALPAAADEDRKVTLNEKDIEVRDLLKSMQKQCGIRNLVIDDDVAGTGSVFFKDVPCSTAFRVVFRQFGLVGQPDPTLMHVETRKR